MNTFIHDDFLLQNKFASRLYHEYAKNLPIIDYHCHLSPADIAANTQFNNLTEVWLNGDHYKWRAMRTLGIDEQFITGKASPEEKFEKWATATPYTMRNPLYHWTHLELERYFGIRQLLNEQSAPGIYKESSALLNSPDFATRPLLTKMNVEVVCTTDDPIDSLEHHQKIATDNFETRVLPTFRPDKSFAVENPAIYKVYIGKLSTASGIAIRNFDDLLTALEKRIDFFHAQGGRLADHGLDQLPSNPTAGRSPDQLFQSVLTGNEISATEVSAFKYHVLIALCRMYHARGWAQQFHLGANRNTNTRMLKKLGPDTGFDSIGDFSQCATMTAFFNTLDLTDQLPKTIIYNLNPSDNEVMATMIGNFNDGSVKGKMQFGSAWWFLDQRDGMEKQMNTLSYMGILSCFIGMLTDSRSFLSFPRHEYFRRILCNLIGKDVENGELPSDEKWLGKMVADISYHNARNYFSFSQTGK